jgi:hypothetical protein
MTESHAAGPPPAAPRRSLPGAILREPLLHFLVIGLLIFLVAGRNAPAPVPDASDRVITLGPADIERLVAQYEAVWRRPPTPSERQGLLADYIREEVYYREALALGLDRDDAVVRRRLVQKIEFLGQSAASGLIPEEAKLRAWYEANSDRFVRAARLSFEQRLIGSEAEARAALRAVAAGADPDSVGRPGLLPPEIADATEGAIDRSFGTGFFAAVAALAGDGWQGPVASGYGWHIVRVRDRAPAVRLVFEEVRSLVEEEWRRDAAERFREAQDAALLSRYRIELPPGETLPEAAP